MGFWFVCRGGESLISGHQTSLTQLDLLLPMGAFIKTADTYIIGSKNLEIIEKFKEALGLKSKIALHARGGEKKKRYLYTSFSNKTFHKYLQAIGIAPNKSKNIHSVDVPQQYFPDFLRGLFDGDGTFYSYSDIRWPNSFCFKTSIASASLPFVYWLKDKLTNYYGVKGCIHKGAGVYNLEYVKGDSRKLFAVMYHSANLLFFSQKYNKIRNAFEKDRAYGMLSLQKQRMPR